MKLQYLRPILWVDDVKRTIEYYVGVLGFKFGDYIEELNWGFVLRDEVQFMFSKPPQSVKYNSSQFTGSLYLNTDDVDSWWAYLKDKVEIVYPIDDFAYLMREFAIKDCNGYILQFGKNIS